MRNNVKKLSLRVTEEEYRHLKALSAASGLKIEPTIRKLILGAELRPRPPDAYADLLRELSAIGNNINQIAHCANAKRNISNGSIEDAVDLVRQALQLVRERL